jgi:hypothetical protein
MSERERWVVYPLLFLALGAALRDKLIDRTITRNIVCQELSVIDEETPGNQPPRVLARFGRSGSARVGTLEINGQLRIVDGEPSNTSPPRIVAQIGRTQPPPDGPSRASGTMIVDGAINAKQYDVQDKPLIPSILDFLLRALQQSGQVRPNVQTPRVQPQAPPPTQPKKPRPSAAPSSPAGEQAP